MENDLGKFFPVDMSREPYERQIILKAGDRKLDLCIFQNLANLAEKNHSWMKMLSTANSM